MGMLLSRGLRDEENGEVTTSEDTGGKRRAKPKTDQTGQTDQTDQTDKK